jgi:protein-S-isoprenylcysteine O-methyltransferase Ste14
VNTAPIRPNRFKSYTLVIVQFGALIALALTGPIIARYPAFLAMEIAGLAVGVWAILAVRIRHVNVTPDVRRGSRLVREGPYRWIRHPMYSAILLGALALVLDELTPLRLVIYGVLLVNLIVKLTYEEQLLAAAFPIYSAYQEVSKRLIPFIY